MVTLSIDQNRLIFIKSILFFNTGKCYKAYKVLTIEDKIV